MKSVVFLSLGILSIIFISGCTQQSTTGGAINNPVQTNNCKDVQVPYLKTEYYMETVPYTDTECQNVPLIYKKETGSCTDRVSGLFGLGDRPAKYSCTITNLDSVGGTFSMNIGFNAGGQKLETTQNKYIYAQSSETFEYQYDAKIDGCYCSEQVPTKQVCHDVTKYRDVQRERQVTAYRTEQQCQ